MDKNASLNKYYLGVDWGTARCGLAIADGETRIATGLEEVGTGQLLDRIGQLHQEHGLSKMIIGTVSHQGFGSGNKNQIEKLQIELERMGLESVLQEEFFSTKLAQQNLAQTGNRGISKSDNVESARIILQSWLDK